MVGSMRPPSAGRAEQRLRLSNQARSILPLPKKTCSDGKHTTKRAHPGSMRRWATLRVVPYFPASLLPFSSLLFQVNVCDRQVPMRVEDFKSSLFFFLERLL